MYIIIIIMMMNEKHPDPVDSVDQSVSLHNLFFHVPFYDSVQAAKQSGAK